MLERKRGKKSPSKLRLSAPSLLPLSATNTSCAILHASASRTHRRMLNSIKAGPWNSLAKRRRSRYGIAIMSFFLDLGMPSTGHCDSPCQMRSFAAVRSLAGLPYPYRAPSQYQGPAD